MVDRRTGAMRRLAASAPSLLCIRLLAALPAAAAAASAGPPPAAEGATTTAQLVVVAAPTHLRLGLMVEPLGVDRLHSAQFSWRLMAAAGPSQLAAQLIVSESTALITSSGDGAAAAVTTLKQVWSSGQLATDQPEHVADLSAALRSDTAYSWTVRIWTADGASSWSDPTTFSTGLLQQSEWKASWIRGGTQMRKEFVVAEAVSRASLFVSACQYYALFLDGERVGDQRLDSPWTNFYTNRSYTTHDISAHLLSPGKHVLGLRVGQGFCASSAHDAWDENAERSAIVQLHLHGATAGQPPQRVKTDTSWNVSDGPIREDSAYYGETYDSRLETPGWDRPGFVPAEGRVWTPAQTNFSVVAFLSSQMMPPVKAVKEIKALTMTRVKVTANNATCTSRGAGADGEKPLALACGGSTIKSVAFFSYGTPAGTCEGGLRKSGACASGDNVTQFVSSICVGQESCSVTCHGKGCTQPSCTGGCTVTAGGKAHAFAMPDPCVGSKKTVAMSVTCATHTTPTIKQPYKYVYDFGQEFAGVVRVVLPPNMPRGANVTLKHAEALAHEPLAVEDGSVYMGNLFWANPVDVYITKGGSDPEVHTPEFTYHVRLVTTRCFAFHGLTGFG